MNDTKSMFYSRILYKNGVRSFLSCRACGSVFDDRIYANKSLINRHLQSHDEDDFKNLTHDILIYKVTISLEIIKRILIKDKTLRDDVKIKHEPCYK